MPITLGLALFAFVIALVVGGLAGIASGTRPGTLMDRLSVVGATLGVSVPSYVAAMFLIYWLAVKAGWLPAIGYVPLTEDPVGWAKSMILPGVALSAMASGVFARQLRSGLVESLDTAYVRTAWASGSHPARVVGKHALRNGAIPATAAMGVQLATLLGGTVIIEHIFSMRGLGTYLFESVIGNDLPAVQAVLVWYVIVQIVINLVVDVVLVMLNPQLRAG